MALRQVFTGIVNAATLTSSGSSSPVVVGNWLTAALFYQPNGAPTTPSGSGTWTSNLGNVLSFAGTVNNSGGGGRIYVYTGLITVGGTESMSSNLGGLGGPYQSIIGVESTSRSGIDTSATGSGIVTVTDSGYTTGHTGGSMTPGAATTDLLAFSFDPSNVSESYTAPSWTIPTNGTIYSASVYANAFVQNIDAASVAAHTAGFTTNAFTNISQVIIALAASTPVYQPSGGQVGFFVTDTIVQN